ncbi:hypothetical protein [Microbacterium sp. 22296]
MNHFCYHGNAGPVDVHRCHCGIEKNHTTEEFKTWHAERGIPILASQIA